MARCASSQPLPARHADVQKNVPASISSCVNRGSCVSIEN